MRKAREIMLENAQRLESTPPEMIPTLIDLVFVPTEPKRVVDDE